MQQSADPGKVVALLGQGGDYQSSGEEAYPGKGSSSLKGLLNPHPTPDLQSLSYPSQWFGKPGWDLSDFHV